MQCWLFTAHNIKKRSRAAPFGKWLPWVFRFFLTGCRMSQIHPAGCRMSRPPRNLKKKRKSGEWAVAVLFGGLRSIYPSGLMGLRGERRGFGAPLRGERRGIGARGIGAWHLGMEKENLMLKFYRLGVLFSVKS